VDAWLYSAGFPTAQLSAIYIYYIVAQYHGRQDTPVLQLYRQTAFLPHRHMQYHTVTGRVFMVPVFKPQVRGHMHFDIANKFLPVYPDNSVLEIATRTCADPARANNLNTITEVIAEIGQPAGHPQPRHVLLTYLMHFFTRYRVSPVKKIACLFFPGSIFKPAPVSYYRQQPGRRPPWFIPAQFPFADCLLADAHLLGHYRLGHIQVLSQRLDPPGIPTGPSLGFFHV
jgi:hypothetical protein